MIAIPKLQGVYGNVIEMNQPALDVNGAIVNYPAANNNSASFNFKQTKKNR